MPELPEVETVRRGLEPALSGQVIVRVEQRRADLRFAFPDRFVERLEGCRITSLSRRAKYLLARLSSGEVLVMHLGMSGRFTVVAAKDVACGQSRRGDVEAHQIGDFVHETGALPEHDHVVLHMGADTAAGVQTGSRVRVVYNDPRRFGFMLLVAENDLEAHPLFADLGPEPVGNELSPDYVAARALGRRSDLKAFLLDQRVIAGLGNIYVCEALHRAGLSPRRRAGCLAVGEGKPSERAVRLVPVIRQVIAEAIAAGGSTLRDYRHADGALGYFQHTFRVYGREGEPCLKPGCGGTVRRLVQAGRSTFYCGLCQR